MVLTKLFWLLAAAVAVLLVVTIFPALFISVVAAIIAVTAAANSLLARVLGTEVGCLAGGLVALGWLWLIAQVDGYGAWAFLGVGVGIPVVLVVAARRYGTEPSARTIRSERR